MLWSVSILPHQAVLWITVEHHWTWETKQPNSLTLAILDTATSAVHTLLGGQAFLRYIFANIQSYMVKYLGHWLTVSPSPL
jgi:hypothetical protein